MKIKAGRLERMKEKEKRKIRRKKGKREGIAGASGNSDNLLLFLTALWGARAEDDQTRAVTRAEVC